MSSPGPRRSSSVGLAGARAGSISTGGGPAGPSLLGLLASKRFAKKLTTRFFNRRMWGSSRPLGFMYWVLSRSHVEVFFWVEELLKTVLEEKLEKFRYSPKICPNMCKILSDDIKEKVKQMNFDRYKIVCNVLIGQKKDQGVMTCSRCVWDEKLDNFASYSFQNEHIFCTATLLIRDKVRNRVLVRT
nr:hypothetical protein BaRGS_030797 [Batillaria attramentaria]